MLDRYKVYVEGEGWIPWDESKMKFLNVSESPEGHDVYTFEYKGKTYESKMIRH